MPSACSFVDELTSSTRPFTLSTLDVIALTDATTRLTRDWPCDVLAIDASISEAVSCAACAERCASVRTSSATTAKPMPAAPARAASTAAFSARMLVWNAISSIVLMMRATLLLDSWIDSIETTISDSALFESSTRPCTSVTSTAASCACLALVRVIVAICSSDAEVSSSEAACSFEPIDSDCAEEATCPAAEAICVRAGAQRADRVAEHADHRAADHHDHHHRRDHQRDDEHDDADPALTDGAGHGLRQFIAQIGRDLLAHRRQRALQAFGPLGERAHVRLHLGGQVARADHRRVRRLAFRGQRMELAGEFAQFLRALGAELRRLRGAGEQLGGFGARLFRAIERRGVFEHHRVAECARHALEARLGLLHLLRDRKQRLAGPFEATLRLHTLDLRDGDRAQVSDDEYTEAQPDSAR